MFNVATFYKPININILNPSILMARKKKDEKIKVVKEIKSSIKELPKGKKEILEEEIDEESLARFQEFFSSEEPIIVRRLPSEQPVEVLDRDLRRVFTGGEEKDDDSDKVKYNNVSSEYSSRINNQITGNNGSRTMADEGTIPVIDQWDSLRGSNINRRGVDFSNPDFEKIQNYVPAEEQDATKYKTGVGVAGFDEERERTPGERRKRTF